MPQSAFNSPFESFKFPLPGVSPRQKKKRKTLTPGQRIYIWERPKRYGRTCSICHERITRLSDLELDHTRAFSKGGTKQALAHKECNRLKGRGSLGRIQRILGLKTKKRKIHKRKSIKRKIENPFRIQQIKIPKFKF